MRGSSGLEIALCGTDSPAHLVPMELEPNLLGASTKRCKHRMAGPHSKGAGGPWHVNERQTTLH